MNHFFPKYFLGIFILLNNVGFAQSTPSNPLVETIYFNGNVLTVDVHNSVVQAVAIGGGKIIATGDNQKIIALKSKNTILLDLQGKTLAPGFIDGHSHFMSLQRNSLADVSAPPVGSVKNVSDLVNTIDVFRKRKNIADGAWINAFGYDQDQLEEKRHPTKEDLDLLFPNNPVVVTHVSGHMLVANSLALKISGIDSSTSDPSGGVIVRKPGSKEPTGLLQEQAGRLLKRPIEKELSKDARFQLLEDQQLFYASNGITTAQDGYSSLESVRLLKSAADQGKLFIDLEILPGYQLVNNLIDSGFVFGKLNNHLSLAGFKLVADGSPQGKTAFFTSPYLTPVPGCESHSCTGVSTVTQEELNKAVLNASVKKVRTFVHCNGDAAIDMYMKALELAEKTYGSDGKIVRPVVIHSQFVRPDQLNQYKALGVIPAFFSNHAFFWGDVHVRNLGLERANFLSPFKTTLSKGIIATNHTDWGVTPLNQLFLLWTAVERKSRSGIVIGSNERLNIREALRTITINGAFEYQEEKVKGSIEPGKLADFVILSEDIYTIPAEQLKTVHVLETIKEGKTIYNFKQ